MSSDDDLDDLLNEVETALSSSSTTTSASLTTQRVPPHGSGGGGETSNGDGGGGGVNDGSVAGGRCTYLCLGHLGIPVGTTRSLTTRVACAAQRCTACDFAVLQFRLPGGAQWARDVDYMVFRNDYPDTIRLTQRLVTALGGVAYCCQCSWVSMLPEDGAMALCVRRPGNIVTPVTTEAAYEAGGGEAVAPVRDGRVGGKGWLNWVCASSHA